MTSKQAGQAGFKSNELYGEFSLEDEIRTTVTKIASGNQYIGGIVGQDNFYSLDYQVYVDYVK